MVRLGIKSDPILYRYSHEWLLDLMAELGITDLQLGSFFEMPRLDDAYFLELAHKAQTRGIRIRSVFTAHRELGGIMTNDRHMEKVARWTYERYIRIAALLGADYVGSSAGAVYRDRLQNKQQGVRRFLEHMKELMQIAQSEGLAGLSIEVMSCSAEPPTMPEEIDYFMTELNAHHQRYPQATVPAYILGDISHGYADRTGNPIHTNYELFEACIPFMNEFHFKNTDSLYNRTFGFSEAEIGRGVVDLSHIKSILTENAHRLPVTPICGYLEHPGPKLGRDYSDCKLEEMLRGSIAGLRKHFPPHDHQ